MKHEQVVRVRVHFFLFSFFFFFFFLHSFFQFSGIAKTEKNLDPK